MTFSATVHHPAVDSDPHTFLCGKKWSEKLTSTKSHTKSTRKTLKNKGTGHCKSWTLDCGLDHGLDYGLRFGLHFGLNFGLLSNNSGHNSVKDKVNCKSWAVDLDNSGL